MQAWNLASLEGSFPSPIFLQPFIFISFSLSLSPFKTRVWHHHGELLSAHAPLLKFNHLLNTSVWKFLNIPNLFLQIYYLHTSTPIPSLCLLSSDLSLSLSPSKNVALSPRSPGSDIFTRSYIFTVKLFRNSIVVSRKL